MVETCSTLEFGHDKNIASHGSAPGARVIALRRSYYQFDSVGTFALRHSLPRDIIRTTRPEESLHLGPLEHIQGYRNRNPCTPPIVRG